MAQVLQQSGTQTRSLYNISKNTIQVNNDIESIIRAEVFKKQIRIKDFFFDFDRLRKGTVTEDKFRSALSMLSIHMTENDIRELINRYKSGPDLVKYTDFVSKIDEQFFDYELAKKNLETTKSVSSVNQNEEQIIIQLFQAIKLKIKTKRIMLKQPFQDFDRTRCSHITVDQFKRVLTLLGLLPDERYYDLLIRRYIDNGNPKEVNYVNFCSDVDNVSEMLETVIKGIKPNQKVVDLNEDILDDTANMNLMSTLYTSKKLPSTNKQLSQVIEKIQAEVVMRRIRIKEFFRDYDILRKGTVTEEQRVLYVSGITLVDNEIQTLLDQYKIDKLKNGLVRYADFCEDIDKVFTTKNIDKDPLAVVNQIQVETTLPAKRRYLNMPEDEAEELRVLLNLYHKEIQNKRVLIKPHFQDFDITQQGYISKNQFLRILNQFGLFPNEKALNLILKRYTDKGTLDEVNYYQFCRDVDIYDEGVEVSQKQADAFKNYQKPKETLQPFIYNDKPNDVHDLLAKLRKKTKEQSIRIQEFLRDFDKLRRGDITNSQMRLGLNMAKLPLSDQEFQLLVEHFKSPNKENHIKWRELCDAVDEVFTQKGLEKMTATVNIQQPSTEYNYGKRAMTEDEKATARDIIQKFSFFCKAKRMDIKQFFQDWDRLGRNKVSPKQFRQVLATVNFPLQDNEFTAICKLYFCPDEKEIRYVDFIQDTKVYQNEFPLEIKQQEHYVSQNTSKRSKDINILLEEIKTATKVNRLRLEEYFRDFDVLRKGKVPLNKFRGVISQMKIDLDEESLKMLEDKYIDENDKTVINYSKFLSDINIVFTLSELEKNPTVQPPEFKKGNNIDQKDLLNEEEDRKLQELLRGLGEVMRKNRINFKSHFQDKDRAKSGKVSFTRFRSILDFHKIYLTVDQFNILIKRFSYQGVEFNYVEFDEALKNYEAPEI